jgi:hypothetical protein
MGPGSNIHLLRIYTPACVCCRRQQTGCFGVWVSEISAAQRRVIVYSLAALARHACAQKCTNCHILLTNLVCVVITTAVAFKTNTSCTRGI